jgi:hypothetical protein
MAGTVEDNAVHYSRARLDPFALHDAIAVLASDCGTNSSRELAARKLLEQLRQLARGRAMNRLLSNPRYRAYGDDLIQDAIQHAAIAAFAGGARFRGSTPEAAVAWCLRILGNYVRLEARRRGPVQDEPLDLVARQGETSSPSEGVHWHAAAPDARIILSSLEARVRAHLKRTRSHRAAKSLYRAVCSYIADVTGNATHTKKGVSRASAAAGSDAQRKARDRTYQHHHRARGVLAELKETYDRVASAEDGALPKADSKRRT